MTTALVPHNLAGVHFTDIAQALVDLEGSVANAKSTLATLLAGTLYDNEKAVGRALYTYLGNNGQLVAADGTKEGNFVVAANGHGLDVSRWHLGYTAADLVTLASDRATAYA